jgi:hypothetical protein
MRRRVSFIIASLFVILTLRTAQAGPLGLTLSLAPDITAGGFLDVEYVNATDLLTVDGLALSVVETSGGSAFNICTNPPTPCDVPGEFHLAATISGAGVLSAGGTLSITGAVPLGSPTAESSPVASLLTGNLQLFAFTFDSGSTLTNLEFAFTVTGGTFAPLYGGIGALGDVEVHDSITGFSLGLGGGDFSGSFTADADVKAVVPEPSTLLLFVTGLIGVVGGRSMLRRRARG